MFFLLLKNVNELSFFKPFFWYQQQHIQKLALRRIDLFPLPPGIKMFEIRKKYQSKVWRVNKNTAESPQESPRNLPERLQKAPRNLPGSSHGL